MDELMTHIEGLKIEDQNKKPLSGGFSPLKVSWEWYAFIFLSRNTLVSTCIFITN
jgi:hypothetical protein